MDMHLCSNHVNYIDNITNTKVYIFHSVPIRISNIFVLGGWIYPVNPPHAHY